MKTPKFVIHRVNSIPTKEMQNSDYGFEIDVREHNKELILCHDPFGKGIYLKSIIPFLENKFIIFNIKAEGIESNIIEICKSLKKFNYFFLDSTMSTIFKAKGKYNFSSRFSEVEPIEMSIKLNKKGLINWVWIDTFTCFPLTKENISLIKINNLQTAFTSPDLLGRKRDIKLYAEELIKLKYIPDIICCKQDNIKVWQNYLN